MVIAMKCVLGDIADVTMGQSPKSEFYNIDGQGMPFLQGNRTFGKRYPVFDTYTTMPTKTAKAGDVIMSVRAPVGDLNFTPVDMCLGRGVCGIRMKNGNQDFLFYLLKYYMPQLLNKESGTVFGSVNRNDIKGLELEIPDDIVQQQRISRALTMLDEKIEVNDAINENLEEQLLAYYRELFITNAKATWKAGTIADLGNVVGGSTPSKKKSEYYTDNGIAWLTPKDLSNDHSKFITHGEIDITEQGLANSSAVRMPSGTVLFSSRAPIGYIAIADGEVTTNQGFKSVVPFAEIGTAFVYCFLKENLTIIENMASGSTFKEISGSTMKVVPAIIPDSDSLSLFKDYADAIFNQQRNKEAENKRLSSIRDLLLPRLMSGELDISDLDI